MCSFGVGVALLDWALRRRQPNWINGRVKSKLVSDTPWSSTTARCSQLAGKWTRVNLTSGSAILTDCAIYVTGKYLIGGENDKVNTPTRIQLDNISAISLKRYHILALNQNGVVYAWGDNGSGECGVDSNDGWIEKPTRVAIPDEYTVIDVSAGISHSMFKCCARK